MFSLNETKNGVWRRTIAYDTLSNIYDDYMDAINNQNMKREDLCVFLVLNNMCVGKARAIVLHEEAGGNIEHEKVVALIETLSGNYYGLFRQSRTKTFRTLDALRDHLFNEGYNNTLIIF